METEGKLWDKGYEMNQEDLLKFAEKNGIRGRRLLSILGKNQQFINALNTPVGIEFLKFLTSRAENNRIVYDTMDIDLSNAKFIEARARYNESMDLLYSFLNIFDNYEKQLNELKGNLSKQNKEE